MNDIREGTVRVRLAASAGEQPYAEFDLSEADLVHAEGSIDRRAAETAWAITHIAEERGSLTEWGLPRSYTRYVSAFGRSGRPAMAHGELAEVASADGERSVWRCTRDGWHLLERQAAASAEAVTEGIASEMEAE